VSDKPPPREDVVLVGGPSPDGEGVRVLRKRDETIELGEMREVKEGQPLQGELVRLSARPDAPRLYDVEVMVSREEIASARRGHAGPAQVATEAYRENWDAIFGQRDTRTLN